ncbi:MAG: chemotaxis-specific protein-glutamate methyltransferase CheB, partial [Chrysiogenetes bacterium]|nr:chemotaxis-specific protein-glutamate methyltransferase CheB [Chrysiogenetes bacterium]
YEFSPDVITLDLEMPGMDGFTFLRLVTQSRPLPVIVVSSRSEDRAIFRALELGATDFIAKPSARISSDIQRIAQELRFKVENIRKVALSNLMQFERGLKPAAGRGAVAEVRMQETPSCVVVGSSTGGPAALHYLLSELPPRFDIPIAIAQHMPRGFTKPFAERLSKRLGRDVIEGEDGRLLQPGQVILAPGGKHLLIENSTRGPKLTIADPAESDRFIPSVDRLFESAVEVFEERIDAVILTGMGNDGLKGARVVHDAGGHVIAESQETAVVYGMPREVVEAGLADKVAALPEIPRLLAAAVNKPRAKPRGKAARA